VACIGLPIAPPGVVQDGLKAFVAERFGKDKSWRYTSTQPAVNRVLQAMGRPIRGIGDRAVVLLLEQRCEQPMYLKCFPGDLQMVPMSDPNGLKRLAERFYRRVHRSPTP
jgi:Rad3-related DNA helicase